MGQFLQKTNVIRDLHEDWEDRRRWYPKEIWSKHVDKWEDLFDPTYREQALNVVSEMVLDALQHAEDCVFYMAAMKEQSVFNFVAIPQAMAIATLECCFRNPAVLERNVKITKGDACQIMLESDAELCRCSLKCSGDMRSASRKRTTRGTPTSWRSASGVLRSGSGAFHPNRAAR